MKKKPSKPKVREVVNETISHYEDNPYDVKEFIERMMTLGYTYETIVDQACLKFKIKKNFAELLVKQVRSCWIAFGELPDNEKRAALEQQLGLLFRMSLDASQFGVAAIALKRKMELAGIQTSSTGRGSVNTNVNIGPQGITAADILPADLLQERKQNLHAMEAHLNAKPTDD